MFPVWRSIFQLKPLCTALRYGAINVQAVRRSMSAASKLTYNSVQPYVAPSWAEGLSCQPTSYVQVHIKNLQCTLYVEYLYHMVVF